MPFNVENIVKARVTSKASNFVNGSIGNATGAVSGAIGNATGAVSGAIGNASGSASGALNSLKNVGNVKELVGAKIGMLKALASGSKPQILNGLKSGADSYVKSFDPGSVIPAQINTKVASLESSVSTLKSQVASLLP